MKRLAAIGVALGTSLPSAAAARVRAELTTIPEDVLTDLLDADGHDDEDHARLFLLLGADPRPAVRVQAALSLARRAPPLTPEVERVLEKLAVDSWLDVRRALTVSLGPALEQMSGIDRAALVCGWASSPSAEQRLAMASALRWPIEGIGVPEALLFLSQDAFSDVRNAAQSAIRLRTRV